MRISHSTGIHLSVAEPTPVNAHTRDGHTWVSIGGSSISIFYDTLDELRAFLSDIDNAASYQALLDEPEVQAS